MARGNYVSYLRVSTQKQGKSGLGLEAQRKAVEDYLDGGRWTLLAEFIEVEFGQARGSAEAHGGAGLLQAHRRSAGDREARPPLP